MGSTRDMMIRYITKRDVKIRQDDVRLCMIR